MTTLALLVAVSLAGVFFCSISQSSLYAIPRHRIETLRRRRAPGAETLARLRDRVEEPIAAILALNTALHTLTATYAGALVQGLYGPRTMVAFSLAFTFALLYLGEIVPKTLGVRYADRLAPRLAVPLRILVLLLWPVVVLCGLVARLGGPKGRVSHPTEEDVLSTVLLSAAGGKILPEEAKWIRNALRLKGIKVRDIMTPARAMARVSEKLPLSMTQADAAHWRYSTLPVCRDDAPDRIVGVVLRREVFTALLKGRLDATMRELMHPVRVVPDGMPGHDLIEFFLRNKEEFAMVRDGKGEVTGVVTLEDVLQRLIGARIV